MSLVIARQQDIARICEAVKIRTGRKTILWGDMVQAILDIEGPAPGLTEEDLPYYNTKHLKVDASNVGSSAWEEAPELEGAELPAELIKIGNYAFKNATSLKTIKCAAKVPPELGRDVFDGCVSLEAVYVPAESVAEYKQAEGWAKLADIIFAIEEE